MSYFMLVRAVLVSLVYTTLPYLTAGYLEGGIHSELLQVSYQTLRKIPTWIGGGLGYIYNLLLPLSVNTEQESITVQLHNQHMQMLVQNDIVGLLLRISTLGSMLWIVRCQRNMTLVVLASLWIILRSVDLLGFIRQYVVGVMFLLCLMLSAQGNDKLQQAD